MKKLLALVMALVMSLSLVTISSNAAFGDQAKIEHTEAVQIMASLGILAGKEDGNFDPTGTLTRAEAAKIITYMLIGTESASKLTSSGTEFSDVQDHWAAPYVAYCSAQGIINGNGDGTFDPEGKLTGYAFAKMLLVAIGFDGDYTGAAWQASVAADLEKTEDQSADEKGLKEEIEKIVLSNEISRDEAAQMAFNALFFADEETCTYRIVLGENAVGTYGNVEKKEFDSYQDAYTYMLACGVEAADNKADDNGDVIYTIVTEGKETLAEDNFGVQCIIGGYLEVNQANSLNEYTTVYNPQTDEEVNLNYVTGLDMIGHLVDVYYDGEWEYEDGDKEEDKGVCYTIVDKTTVVDVAEAEALSKAAVKSLLGVTEKDFDPAGRGDSLYIVGNGGFADDMERIITGDCFHSSENAPIQVNEDDNSKYDIAAGQYLLYENEDEELELYGYRKDLSILACFDVELTDEENKYYTVTTQLAGDTVTVVNVEEDEDDCFNTINQNIDWLSYLGKGAGNENYDDQGSVVFAITPYGWSAYYDGHFRIDVAEVQTLTGKVTKRTTNADKEIYKIYVDGTAYDYNTDSGVLDSACLASLYEKSEDVIPVAAVLPEVATDKDVVFFLLNGEIVAWINEDTTSDSKMILPIKLYYIDACEDEDAVDEYGDPIASDDERYTFFLQGVDANGDEVKLNLNVLDDSLNTFLSGFASASEIDDETAIAVAVEAIDGKLFKNLADDLFFYTTENEDGVDYAYFQTAEDYLADDDNDDEEYVATVTTQDKFTKDDTRIYASQNDTDANFLLSSGYSVIVVSGEGADLKISTFTNSYAKIKQGAILYGTKDAKKANYNLKNVFVISENANIAGDELIFVAEDFTNDNATKLTYTDKNGKSKTITAYEQEVYVGAEKKTILTTSYSTTIGLYEYEIDEYKGTYDLDAYDGIGTEWAMDIVDIENNDGYLTFAQTGWEDDMDVEDAVVVNTTEYTNAPTAASKLGNDTKHAYTVCVKLDEDADVEYIYIYKATPMITLQYNDGEGYVDIELEYQADGTYNANIPAAAIGQDIKIVKTSAQGLSISGLDAEDYKGNVIDADDAINGRTITVSEKNCDKVVITLVKPV